MSLLDKEIPIGREGIVQSNGLQISVIIRDARLQSLVLDYLIEPTAGTGLAWIESDRVSLVEWPA